MDAYMELICGWLSQKSAAKQSYSPRTKFEELIVFLLDRFDITWDDDNAFEIKRSKNDDSLDINDLVDEFWTDQFSNAINLSDSREIIEPCILPNQTRLLPHESVLKLFFVIYEDIRYSLYYANEAKYLKVGIKCSSEGLIF